jgi:glycosyltransferase involved in cell wall biosynthesis
MGKVKIALVTQFPREPSAPLGGVEAVSVNLTKHLSAYKELDVHVVTQSTSVKEYTSGKWENATIHWLPRPGGGQLANVIWLSKRIVWDILEDIRPDLVHAHDSYGILMTGNNAFPCVFTVHGFIHGDTLLSGRRFARVRSWIWKYFEERTWRDQPNVISISPYVRERVSRVARGTVYDIENPVAASFFDVARDEARPDTVFSSAVLSPRKNPIALVKAIGHLVKDGYTPVLRLAGTITNEAYGIELKRVIADMDLGSHVTLLGNIPTTQVREELAQATVYALVSLEENSPMGIAEAMAAGVPVVTSNRCGMPYMVRNGETGYLVDPSSPSQIAYRLQRLFDDRALRLRLGHNASLFAKQWFHPEAVARRTQATYDDILRRRVSLPIDNAFQGG